MVPNVGIIGCGRWGMAHLSTLLNLKIEGRIGKIFICDINQEVLEKISHKIDGFFKNWREMATSKKIDIIAVVTPPDSHEEISIELLKRGIDILVEKPLATSFDGATSILNTSQTFGRILSVGYLLRFHSAINTALEKISNGLIGALERVEFTRITTRKPTKYTDIFQALGTHGIDTACYCFGELEPERTHLSKVRHDKSGKAISAEILLEFPGQKEAEIIVAWNGEEEQRTLRFFGEKGIIFVDLNNHNELLYQSNDNLLSINTITQQSPLELEWLHIIAMFEGNEPNMKRISPSQGAILRGIRLIDRITDIARIEFGSIHDKIN